MLMILARLVCSESFWAVVKVRSPHTGPEVCYIIKLPRFPAPDVRLRAVLTGKRSLYVQDALGSRPRT